MHGDYVNGLLIGGALKKFVVPHRKKEPSVIDLPVLPFVDQRD